MRVRVNRLAGNSMFRTFGDVRAGVKMGNGSVAELAEKGTDIWDLFQRTCAVHRDTDQYLDTVKIVLNV